MEEQIRDWKIAVNQAATVARLAGKVPAGFKRTLEGGADAQVMRLFEAEILGYLETYHQLSCLRERIGDNVLIDRRSGIPRHGSPFFWIILGLGVTVQV